MTKTSCGIYLFDLDNKLLLVGHITGQGNKKFSIPKGVMDEIDKTHWDAAKREFFEETNIEYENLKIICTHEFDFVKYKSQDKILKSFLVVVRDFNCSIKCTSTYINKNGEELPELDYFKWVTLEKAKNVLSSAQIENLDKIKNIFESLN